MSPADGEPRGGASSSQPGVPGRGCYTCTGSVAKCENGHRRCRRILNHRAPWEAWQEEAATAKQACRREASTWQPPCPTPSSSYAVPARLCTRCTSATEPRDTRCSSRGRCVGWCTSGACRRGGHSPPWMATGASV